MKTMISVAEAQELVQAHAAVGAVEKVPLTKALGAVLSSPVKSQMDVPAFDNSAMDGFMLDQRATVTASPKSPVRIAVTGYQSAGPIQYPSLQSGTALRVATGAFVPPDATTVIPQELVTEEGDTIVITAPAKVGAHIRRCAEETKRGETVLTVGTLLTPSVVGYLASLGVDEVPVYTRPRVGIVATGTELVPLGATPGPGQIYDSNSVALSAALQVDGITARTYPAVSDDPVLQKQALALAISENDIVLVTGGVSVGRYDHVKDIMTQLEITPVFWKVRQKPGKPLVFGTRGQSLFFGLPGNPASSLVSYYEYVRPAVCQWMGIADGSLQEIVATCDQKIVKDDARAHFLRAWLTCQEGVWRVTPREGQGSHCMRSFADANALLALPEGTATVSAGDSVRVHMLPHRW